MKFKPLGERALVRMFEREERTAVEHHEGRVRRQPWPPPRTERARVLSIQARNPYHATSTAVGGRSVRINQGSR